MGYQTDRNEKCKSSWMASTDPDATDEYGDPLPAPVCNWVATSTYSDECTVCGAIAYYG